MGKNALLFVFLTCFKFRKILSFQTPKCLSTTTLIAMY